MTCLKFIWFPANKIKLFRSTETTKAIESLPNFDVNLDGLNIFDISLKYTI